MEGENSSTLGTEYPASTTPSDSTPLTPPCPFVPTPAPPWQALANLASTTTSTLTSDVYFGPVIEEALLYADLAQSPYPPLEVQ